MGRARRAAFGITAFAAGLSALWFAAGTGVFASDRSLRPGESSAATAPEEPSVFRGGLWKQITTAGQLGSPVMRIDGPGRGVLTATFSGITAALVGAKEVTMETSWLVDGDRVEFHLHGGEPDPAYQRLLLTALEEATVFRVEEKSRAKLVLVRVPDGERFEWRRQVQ